MSQPFISAPDPARPASSPMHPSFIAAQNEGVIPAATIQPIWAALEPLVVLMEPHINFLAFWAIIASNSRQSPAAILRALDAASSQIILAPAFDAQLFGIACRVAANLYDHFHPPAVTVSAIPAAAPLGAPPAIS